MDKIPQELLTRLDALAAKIGTTVGHLWQVLITQARVEAIVAAARVALSLVGVVACCFWLLSMIRRGRSGELTCDHGYHEGEAYASAIVEGVILVAVSLASVIMLLVNLAAFPTLLLNPEYWALQQIMGLLN